MTPLFTSEEHLHVNVLSGTTIILVVTKCPPVGNRSNEKYLGIARVKIIIHVLKLLQEKFYLFFFKPNAHGTF